MKTITTTAAILTGMILIITGMYSAQTTTADADINDSIIKIKAKQINYPRSGFWNDTVFVETYDVIYFVQVNGSPTYSFSQREFIDVILDLDKMNQFNNSIENGIKKRAKDIWNYTLPASKISYHAYSKGN